MKDSDTDGFLKRLINKAKDNIPHTIAVTIGVIAALAFAVWLFVYFKESSEASHNVEELKKLKEQIENDPENREPGLLTPTQIPTSSPTSDARRDAGSDPDGEGPGAEGGAAGRAEMQPARPPAV